MTPVSDSHMSLPVSHYNVRSYHPSRQTQVEAKIVSRKGVFKSLVLG